jgi:hypothetical protein
MTTLNSAASFDCRSCDVSAIANHLHQHVVVTGPVMEKHDNPLNASEQLGATPSASTRYEGPTGEKPTPGHRAADTSKYAHSMQAGDRLPVANARAKGAFCYLATAPVNYFATRNQSDFLLHHRRQSLALSFLGACTVGMTIALLVPTVWLLLAWDRAELALSSSQVIAVFFLLLAVALTAAGLAGIFTAARGSVRPLPVLARLGRMPWVRLGGLIGKSLIITFPRISLYLEHAVFLWYTAPRLIAANNFS